MTHEEMLASTLPCLSYGCTKRHNNRVPICTQHLGSLPEAALGRMGQLFGPGVKHGLKWNWCLPDNVVMACLHAGAGAPRAPEGTVPS